MRSWILALSVLALYLLHQDFWFWRDARLVFGVLPIGLFYHAAYCVACTGLMWALVRFAWPASLDDELRTGTGTGR
jgi:O-antigen ligase